MTPARKHLGELFRSHRDLYIQHTRKLLEAFHKAGIEAAGRPDATQTIEDLEKVFAQYDDASIGQMVDGSLMIMNEALASNERSAYQIYIETIVPALIASGVPPRSLLESNTAWTVTITADVARNTPPELLDECIAWVQKYFMDYNADVAVAAGVVPAMPTTTT